MDNIRELRAELDELVRSEGIESDKVYKLASKLIKANGHHLKAVAKERPLLGAHVSIAGGYQTAIYQGKEIGADAVALFVTSPKMWGVPSLAPNSLEKWNTARALTGVEPGNVHGSYLINLASLNETLYQNSIQQIISEVERCAELDAPLYTFHPGSRNIDTPMAEALERVAEALSEVLEQPASERVTVCLENTAGSKHNTKLGGNLEDLGTIIKLLPAHLRKRVGITLDTCHLWASGYDISTEEGYEVTMSLIQKKIGMRYVKAFHLNGCQSSLGQKLDRHAPIGAPPLDLTPFRMIMNDPRLKGKYMNLETPDPSEWAEEIIMLKSLVGWGESVSPLPKTVGQQKTTNFSEIRYGKRPYLMHNIQRPFTTWPGDYWGNNIKLSGVF